MKVDVRNGVIYLGDGQLDEPIELEPAEASALAGRLGQAAHLAWRQQSAIAAACEGGHDWGTPYNGWLGQQHVTVEPCQRPGCHELQLSQGWMPFAGRFHVLPWGEVLDCWGLGCDHCDALKLGEAMRTVLAGGMAAIDQAALGVPLGGVGTPTV